MMRRAGLLVLSMTTWTITYALVARHPWRAPIVTHIALDDTVPLWRPAIWIYVAPYIVAPVVAALIRDATFAAALRRAWATFALGTLAFLVAPTIVARPAFADDRASITAQLHTFVVAVDTPAGNAAPSLHVALAVLLAWAIGKDAPRARFIGWPFAVAIALSTLLTGQHHLIDVVTGAALAITALWVARRIDRRPDDRRAASSPSSRPGGASRSPPPP